MSTVVLGLVTGLAFGFALQRAGFSRCNIVQRGLWLRDFTMLKVMLTAIVVGLVGSVVIDALAPGAVHFKVKSLYVAGVAAGGLLFGIGIAIGGYCPGTAIVGTASGVGEGIATLLGGLIGALAFIFAYPALKPLFFETANLGKVTLPSVLGVPPLLAALVVAAALWGVIVWLVRLERAPHATK